MNTLKRIRIISVGLIPLVLLSFIMTSCGDGRSRRGGEVTNDTITTIQDGDKGNVVKPVEVVPSHDYTKINKATFYIEN